MTAHMNCCSCVSFQFVTFAQPVAREWSSVQSRNFPGAWMPVFWVLLCLRCVAFPATPDLLIACPWLSVWSLWLTSHLLWDWQCLPARYHLQSLLAGFVLFFRIAYILLNTWCLDIGFLKSWALWTKVNPCLFNLVGKMDLPLIPKCWVQCSWDLS